jgi:hypothetical protein
MAKSENETHDEKTKVAVVEDDVGNVNAFEIEGRVFQSRRYD